MPWISAKMSQPSRQCCVVSAGTLLMQIAAHSMLLQCYACRACVRAVVAECPHA